MTVKVSQLPVDAVSDFWQVLEPYVETALQYDPFNAITPQAVLEQVQKGYSVVLIASRDLELLSATVVQIHQTTPEDRTIHVLCTAGEHMHLWLKPLHAEFVRLAYEHGANEITMRGRPGWAKKLHKVLGYKVAQVSMVFEVQDGRNQQVKREFPAAIAGAEQ